MKCNICIKIVKQKFKFYSNDCRGAKFIHHAEAVAQLEKPHAIKFIFADQRLTGKVKICFWLSGPVSQVAPKM